MSLTTSVLIPSFRRAAQLTNCLHALDRQTIPPSEVIVVWQADDAATRDAVVRLSARVSYLLRAVHSAQAGVIGAENAALDCARGEIVLLIDDDAIAPETWIERHLIHYRKSPVGAVGGPANNFRPDGTPFPRRTVGPVGQLSWYGKLHGNMYDHPPEWRARPPRDVDHLVGYNFSFRRCALARFHDALLPYWQMFELDACLTIRGNGYRILFDYGNTVKHYPTNTAYAGGRSGDLDIKIFNSAFNHACVLARHSRGFQALVRWFYLMGVGTVENPGVVASLVACHRYGQPARELSILLRTWNSRVRGWRTGLRARMAVPTPAIAAVPGYPAQVESAGKGSAR